MTRTLDEVIENLPVEQQARIKARVAELVMELEGLNLKEATAVPEHEG